MDDTESGDESVTFDELLISYVEHSPNIYDKSTKGYKDDKKKENSWAYIAGQLNSEPELVRKRWDCLRDRFVRAHRIMTQELPTGTGAEEAEAERKVSFPFYNMMLWLVPFIRKRKLTTSVTAVVHPKSRRQSGHKDHLGTETSQILESITLEYVDNFESQNDAEVETDRQFDRQSEHTTLSPSFCIASDTKIPEAKKPTLRTSKQNIHGNVNRTCSALSQLIEKQVHRAEEQNTGDLNFMKSVAADMQTMSKKSKLSFKREVMELLEKYTD